MPLLPTRSTASSSEHGIALVAVLMTAATVSALCALLVLVTTANSAVAASFVRGVAVREAADAALEWAVGELTVDADWNAVLAGRVKSAIAGSAVDTVPGPDWRRSYRISDIVHLATCGAVSPCPDAAKRRVAIGRPWGENNPDWQAYAWGPLRRFGGGSDVPGAADIHIVVLVGDDGAERDGDPGTDAAGAEEAGHGIIVVRAQAYGPLGARAVIEAVVARPVTAAVRDRDDSEAVPSWSDGAGDEDEPRSPRSPRRGGSEPGREEPPRQQGDERGTDDRSDAPAPVAAGPYPRLRMLSWHLIE